MGYNKQSNYLTVIFNFREKKFLAFHFLELWQNVEQKLATFIKLVTALKLFRNTSMSNFLKIKIKELITLQF